MRRTFGYAAMTKDAAQRSIRTFYKVVMVDNSSFYKSIKAANADTRRIGGLEPAPDGKY